MSKLDQPQPHGAATHAGPEPGHGEAHDHPTRSLFVTIWLVLGFLTVVEVMVPRVYSSPWNHTTKMLLLVTLASGKAILVAAYFMHLKWEAKWVRRIAMCPAYMGLAAVLLMIEEHFRPLFG
jgi:cytochrome c oxidase subunit 4